MACRPAESGAPLASPVRVDLHTGALFWPKRDGLPATYPPLGASTTADVAIVGAGITGALAAYELVTAGANVIVLERDDVASGSSAASSGLLLCETDASLTELTARFGLAAATRVYQLGLRAIDRIEAIAQTIGTRSGFSRRRSVYAASRAADVRGLREEYDLRRRAGFDVAYLTAADLLDQHGVRADAAIVSGGAGELDCYRFTHAVLDAVVLAGGRVHDRSRVTRVRHDTGGLEVETDRGACVRAARVVNATGYEGTNVVWRETGQLASTWCFVSEPLPAFDRWPERSLIWETARPYLYLRTTDDGRLLAGGEDEPWAERHRSLATLRRKTARLASLVTRRLPGVRFEVAYAWAGTFAWTEDGLPFLGEIPEQPGVWHALGYGGNGITFGAIGAGLLRDAVLGRPSADAALFGFGRTRPGRPHAIG